jgi:threonine synthase
MYNIVDYKTRKPVHHDNFVFTGGGLPLEVLVDLAEARSRIYRETFLSTPLSVSKYLPFLPIKDYKHFVTLGEGNTPLYRSKNLSRRLGCDLYFKVESKNPTGSFKDRGTAVEMSVAKEIGAKGVSVASTGNMAASCSCYAAAADIPCFVFVPEDTPVSKLAQVISYGGRIVQVKGNYSDAVGVAEEIAKELDFYLAGDYCFRVEGAKTAAYEIAEQFSMDPPDAVFVPMGCGTNLTSYFKGFKEYRDLGFIERLPSMYGVQATGACAVVNSFNSGAEDITPVDRVSTIASAIAVRDPLDGIKALDAIRTTGGQAVAVTDTEMIEGQYLIAKEEGIFTEVSGGATLAALIKLAEKGELQGKRVVCVLCGDGLKDPRSVMKVAVKPPIIRPAVDEFLNLYNNKFFEGRSVAFVDSSETVFAEMPSAQRLAVYLWDKFNTSFPDDYLEKMRQMIEQFLKKGKAVTFSDLQDIVQDALESVKNAPEQVLDVKNFEVKVAMDKKAEATVWVEIDGQPAQGSDSGVGPVDALINALRKACPDHVKFALTSFNVDIRSTGVDAVVYVDLKLVSNGTVSLGRGASPDIIQASLHAFEKAFNGLIG